jgi:putative colanic acid biosynthesis UDP-glucose lipid carrier transferase
MNPFVVFRQSFLIGLVFLVQSVAPAVIAVLVLAFSANFFNQPFDEQYVVLGALVAALTLVFVRPPSDFMLRLSASYWDVLGRVVLRWAGVLGVLLFLGFATKFSAEFSRRAITSWAIITPLLSAGAIVVVSAWLRRLLLATENRRTAVIAGFNDASRRLAMRINDSPEAGMTVRGFFDDRSGERLGVDAGLPLLGRLPELATYVRQHGISVIFVALPMRHLQRVMDLLDDLRDTTASIYYVPDVFVFDLIQSRTGEILGMPVVALCETPFHGFRGVVKRLTDTVFATLILIPLLPVMLVVAVLVKLTSPGSVLFKQRRYGLDGQEIIVYKFRTMTVSEDGTDFVQAKKDDARITPIGHVLRRYSLDELPQLFNVLQGRMSLVGPRPHPIALNEQYRKMIKGYMVRHKVLPGLTGLAQVNGCRGETAKLEEMQARIHYDLDYLRRWTPLLDVKILLLTILRVFRDEKAY